MRAITIMRAENYLSTEDCCRHCHQLKNLS